VGQCEVALEQGRPAAARGVAHLPVAGIDRHAGPPGHGGQFGRQSELGIEPLQGIPFDFQPAKLPRRARSLFPAQGALPHEVRLLELHRPTQTQFERRGGASLDQSFAGRHVVHLDQEQACLDPRDVQSQHPAGSEAIGSAPLHQVIPDRFGVPSLEPEFEAQVTGVAGAGETDRDAADGTAGGVEEPQPVHIGLDRRLQDLARGRPLHGERRHGVGNILDGDGKPGGVLVQPPQIGLRGGEPEFVFGQAGQRAVVQYLAPFLAPGGVNHSPHLQVPHVARDHPIHQQRRIAAPNPVLEEGRDIQQCRRGSDGPILAIVGEFVGTGHEVTRPPAPILRLAQRRGAGVKRCGAEHGGATI